MTKHFFRERTVARGWYPQGSKAQIQYPMTFEKVGTCAAVSPGNDSLYSLASDGFDSDTFIYYLRWLLKVIKTKKRIAALINAFIVEPVMTI